MQITLKPASNGLIKNIYEPSINGAGNEYENEVVYNFQNSISDEEKINFINDIITDLGIETGSSTDSNKLKIYFDWGDDYNPSKDEIEKRIKKLEEEKKRLRKLANQTQ